MSQRKSWLKYINKIFWTNEHRLKIPACVFFISFFLVISLTMTIIYSELYDNYSASCEIYPWWLIDTEFSVFFLLELVYTFMIFWKGLKDKIGMRNEIICRNICSTALVFLLQGLRYKFKIYHTFDGIIQGLNSIFWGTWYPCIFIVLQKTRLKNVRLSGSNYNLQNLEELGKQFFCSENIHFIKKYNQYVANDCDYMFLKEMLNDFIQLNAKYQLNLTQEVRNLILSDPSQIEIVYDEVVEMVRNNLLPYSTIV